MNRVSDLHRPTRATDAPIITVIVVPSTAASSYGRASRQFSANQ